MPALTRQPCAALAPFVQALHYSAGEQDRTSVETILPVAGTSLWVNLHEDEFRTWNGSVDEHPVRTAGAAFEGPRDRPTIVEIETGRAQAWAVLRPGRALTLTQTPVRDVVNHLTPLADLWGAPGDDVRGRLLAGAAPTGVLAAFEQVLLEQLRPIDPDPAVGYALDALDRGRRVADVAGDLGLMRKTFGRRFRRHVGLGPKRYARVQRFGRVLRAIEGTDEVNGADVAARFGYCDQAHLDDDFRDLAGMTPTAYLRRRTSAPHHVTTGRSDTARVI